MISDKSCRVLKKDFENILKIYCDFYFGASQFFPSYHDGKMNPVNYREDVRNLILGYPSLKNKNFGTFLGEIYRINPEILGYPRIPGYPLTTSLLKTLIFL